VPACRTARPHRGRAGCALAAAALAIAMFPQAAAAQVVDASLVARPIEPGALAAGTDQGWRRPDFEVYRWALVPGFVILDTRDYQVQQRLFQRLAFFVEKAGHVGRIEDYEALAGLHGYYAHNYYNEDLARFFTAAEQKALPLLPEEQELIRILESNGNLRRRVDRYEAVPGGILSISRESGTALRRLHVYHELTHAVFYLDRGYSDACRRIWASLDPDVRQFYRLFLAWQQYNVSDDYLLVNEFQAWTLHNKEAGVEEYFRRFAASQLERNLAVGHDTYQAVVDMKGEPFLDAHRRLHEALLSAAPEVTRALDAAR
jgi:hypothetical protein